MTIEKTSKSPSAFSITLIVLFIISSGVILYLFQAYQKPHFYTISDSIPVNDVEMRITSLKVSDRVAGYREKIPSAEIKVGNQTAHAEPEHSFVILKITMTNKEDKITPTSAIKGLMLETTFKQTYGGNSIFDIFQKFSRTDSTEEELRNFYCERFPEELFPKSSATSCLIFYVQNFEDPFKLFYIENAKISFVVKLR